jgi:hypothetical protein
MFISILEIRFGSHANSLIQLLLVVSVLVWPFTAVASSNISAEEYLQSFKALEDESPEKVSEILARINIRIESDTLTVNFAFRFYGDQLQEILAEQGQSMEEWMKIGKTSARSDICADPEYQEMLDHGAKIRWVFLYNDGTEAYSESVTTCGT